MPLFSVVIPTHNRADLLCYTIQGVLNQDFDDYEIIVSDNFSCDNTKQIIRSFSDKRIKYISTVKYLSAGDSWDFAIYDAKGKYIVMMPDDDCMTPKFLSTMAPFAQSEEVNLISCITGRYYYPDFPKPSFRNQLHIEPFTDRVLEFSALETLKKWHYLDCRLVPLPSAVMSRKIIDIVKSKIGRFFFNPAPDYCASSMILSFGGSFILVDRPLLAFGDCAKTYRSTVKIIPGVTIYSPLGDMNNPFEVALLKGHYSINVFVESLFKSKCNLPENFFDFKFAWALYFSEYYSGMQDKKREGYNIERDELEYKNVVSKLTPGLLDNYSNELAIRYNMQKQGPQLVSGQNIILQGEQNGFSNILECASKLEVLSQVNKK